MLKAQIINNLELTSQSGAVMEMWAKNEDMRSLYEAAVSGDAETLNAVIQKDQLILNKVSLNSFHETPLHISALLGHLDFTKVVLARNPKMAAELDSHKRSPLHLASAEGHSEVVRALLGANTDVCFVRDQEGRIPLHLAAMRGRVDVIEELMSAKPDSVAVKVDGDTALHLCVKYNHLDALKLMIEKTNYDDQLINLRNQDSKTILDLAAIEKQFETVSYMLSLHGEKAKPTSESTTLDSATTSLHMQEILREAVAKRTNDLRIDVAQPVIKPDSAAAAPWFEKFKKHCRYQGNWLEETRGSLMVAATILATMSFQAAVSPPGGVWQQDYTYTASPSLSNANPPSFSCRADVCKAGTPVLADAHPESYKIFIAINTIAFISSISIILLIISGIPFGKRFLTWMMTLSMYASLTLIAVSYLMLVSLMCPDSLFDDIGAIASYSLIVWLSLIAVVAMLQVIRFFCWICCCCCLSSRGEMNKM